MADPAWRRRLRPASFRGVNFHVDVGRSVGGRRGVNYEFPGRDDPEDEDFGRRSNRRPVSCYVIGEDYVPQADALEAALNAGAGNLTLPTLRSKRMRCESYDRTERRVEGGWAVFDCVFVEAPASSGALNASTENTQAAVRSAADAAADATELSAGSDADWV